MTHRNVAHHRARELRARLGYLISPEQRRALDELDEAHAALLTMLERAGKEFSRLYEEQR
jgi:hypothetical protein